MTKKITAIALSCMLLLSSVPVNAFTENEGTVADDRVVVSQTEVREENTELETETGEEAEIAGEPETEEEIVEEKADEEIPAEAEVETQAQPEEQIAVQTAERQVIESEKFENIEWVLYNDGEMIISGNGNWPDRSRDFYEFSDEVKNNARYVVIQDGITSIGTCGGYYGSNYAFRNCYNLERVTIPASVTYIGPHAFGWVYNPFTNSSTGLEYHLKEIIYNGTTEQWNKITISAEDNDLIYDYDVVLRTTDTEVPLEITKIGSGTVETDKEKYKVGDEVTLTLKPSTFFAVDYVKINNKIYTDTNTVKFTFKGFNQIEVKFKASFSGILNGIQKTLVKNNSVKIKWDNADAMYYKIFIGTCTDDTVDETTISNYGPMQSIYMMSNVATMSDLKEVGIVNGTDELTYEFNNLEKGKHYVFGVQGITDAQNAQGKTDTRYYTDMKFVNAITSEAEEPTPTPTPAPSTPSTPSTPSSSTTTPAATPTPTPTPRPTATPTPTPTPEPTPEPTPAVPTEADTSVVDISANEEVIRAAIEKVTVESDTATVDKDALESVVDATVEGETVVIPLARVAEDKGTTINRAAVSTDALKEVAEKETDVVVEFSDVTVKLDARSIKAITEQAKGDDIEIRAITTTADSLTDTQKAAIADKETAVVISVRIYSDGEYIGNFNGGKATLKIPFTPEQGKDGKDHTVYYVAGDGNLVEVPSEYVDGYMVITTGHFSDYAVVYTPTLSTTEPAETPVETEKRSTPVLPIVAIAAVVIVALVVLMKKRNAEN